MVGHLKRLIERNTEQEKQRRRTELALLQAQINPHFLYNTLDTIIWLIESGEISESVAMVSSLSNFFRFSLSRGQNVITIQEEQQHIRSYLEIQHMRYRDLMEYVIDIPEELNAYILPKLTLQPLVENALVHGLREMEEGGVVTVYAKRTKKGKARVGVRDNGRGFRAAQSVKARRGVGIENINRRLTRLFRTQLVYTVPEGGGCEVYMEIPWKEAAIRNESISG